MKANELRIGNYVYEQRCDGKLYEGQVTEIRQCDIIDRIKCNGWFADSPIILTEEWLIKFGFDKKRFNDPLDKAICKYVKNKISVQLLKDKSILYKFKYININSVHQLQNLYFALTGEELTINN
jgi:hypothetical protein